MLEYFKKLYSFGSLSFYQIVDKALKNQKRMFIVTANPETFTYGLNNPQFDKLLKDKQVTLIPDGIGIVKSAQMLNFPVQERITGIDLANHLLEVCENQKYTLALLGAKIEVLNSLQQVIKTKYPHIKVLKVQNGYEKNPEAFLKEVAHLKVDVCLVALGIPKQEELIYSVLKEFSKGIIVGVGGSFDVISGHKKRAPKIWQKLNLEWLYRLIKEPTRIKRLYQNNIKFLFKVRKLKRKVKKNACKN